jgi:hypothetical protein
VIEAAKEWKLTPHFIECVCDEDIARERLAADVHPAANRSFELYRALRAKADPFVVPRLILDSGALDLQREVERCIEYLRA